MKRKQFSEEQIIGILREAEAGAVVTDLCRRHGMSSATYYVEGQVRPPGGVRCEGGCGRSRRRTPGQAAADRRDARQRRSGEPALKKTVTPATKREAFAHIQRALG
ncbi:hypothetical protein EQZ23_06410 [Sphingomonas sp. UV9]|nr:hypothetical protein EQZ23_06410 [Sphingomonas sp. UV9]